MVAMKKLAIIVTHPIQYYVPIFQLLAKRCDLKVFYTWGEKGNEAKYDPNFKQIISWDLPMLTGYEHEFLENKAKNPGSHHFSGIVNLTLVNKIKDFKPNAILVYGWSYQSHLLALRKFKGKIPIWFRGDSNLIDQKIGIKSVLRSLLLKWVYQHVDKAFYVGSANKAYFLNFGIKEEQLIFAPHAVDNTRFSEDRGVQAAELRNKLNIGSEEILILFAGKLEAKKNPMLLLQAFLHLKNQNVHLLFVGNGVLEGSLKEMVQNRFLTSLVMTKSVHFIDFQNQTQMPVIYQACDLFCLPSQGPGETWGLAVNEAMACGKAILVSDKVGCAQDLVNNRNGLVFESENLIDLTQKLIALTNDQSILKKMGKESLKDIQNWSFEHQVNAIAAYVNR